MVSSPAQEILTGLQSNFAITKIKNKKGNFRAMATPDTMELPFFDDFSGQSPLPDSTKWLDDYVFINNTYSNNQITMGVATFDALNDSGMIYSNASTEEFEADHLTSKPINLNYPASANIWLSFFYQPGGLGDPPEANDSLTLQFLAPDENIWYSMWMVNGNSDLRFKPVIIPIVDPHFLKKGFQFRFINYASLSPDLTDPSMIGNCDIWNIDYVMLDKNRNGADTIPHDVAMTLPVRSLLKTYEAIPWKQFRQIYLQEMGSFIPIHYRNNDTIIRNVTRNFEIWDVYKNLQSYSFSAGATNINPLTSIDYNANLVYTFNTDSNDSALFRIKSYLITDEFDPKVNDTMVYYQTFKNYFAFDDGSSEAGYGINGQGSADAMVAYRFQSYMQDTLRAISICFNDSYQESNKKAFDLKVWDDNNGLPGNVLYSQEGVMVEQGNTINGFYTYNIPEGVMVDSVFYVGWKQLSETFLNAGFDVNTPNNGRQFYRLNGEWQQSQMNGSIMIRPVVGDPLKLTSINDVHYGNNNLITIWPNPAIDYININSGEQQLSGSAFITVMDMTGRELIKVPFSERIDISSLRNGVYIIITSKDNVPLGYNRLIKTR